MDFSSNVSIDRRVCFVCQQFVQELTWKKIKVVGIKIAVCNSYKRNNIVKLERDNSLITSLSISPYTTVYTTGISIWNICEYEPTTNMAYMANKAQSRSELFEVAGSKKFKHQRVCTTSQNFNILGGK